MKKLFVAALALISISASAQDERIICSCGEVCACDSCPAYNNIKQEAFIEIDKEDPKPIAPKKDCARAYFGFDFGFIGLDGKNGAMATRKGHSLSIAPSMGARFTLNKRESVRLDLGLRPRWDNYVFDDKITITHDGFAMPIDPKYKKSKLMAFSLDLPVTLNFKVSRYMSIATGVYGGVLLASHTKIKFPRHKDHDDFGLNRWQAGATLRVKLYKYLPGIFANYSLTPLFEDGKTRPFTVGLFI